VSRRSRSTTGGGTAPVPKILQEGKRATGAVKLYQINGRDIEECAARPALGNRQARGTGGDTAPKSRRTKEAGETFF